MAKRKEIVNTELEKITTLASLGFSVKSIAASLGISKATFDRRAAESEDIQIALGKGRANSYEMVAATAFKMATSGNHPSMTQFWLKCREGWTDKESSSIEQAQIVINYELFDDPNT